MRQESGVAAQAAPGTAAAHASSLPLNVIYVPTWTAFEQCENTLTFACSALLPPRHRHPPHLLSSYSGLTVVEDPYPDPHLDGRDKASFDGKRLNLIAAPSMRIDSRQKDERHVFHP